MKLPREHSQQSRKVNQSTLVALSVIANIHAFSFGGCSGFAERRVGAESPGTFFQYTFHKSMISMMTIYHLGLSWLWFPLRIHNVETQAFA